MAAPDRLKKFAASLSGIDTGEFDECLDSGKYHNRVEYNSEEATRQGVTGTPTFVIVGPDGSEQRIVGAQPYHVFRDAIESVA